MTPVGHIAVSGIIGGLVYRVTGIPSVAALVAFLIHIPSDWILNEYYGWDGKGQLHAWAERLFFLSNSIPAIVFLAISLYYWPMAILMGLIGVLPDVIDAVLYWAFKFEIFPCHSRSLWYWQPVESKMLTFYETIDSELLLAFALMFVCISTRIFK